MKFLKRKNKTEKKENKNKKDKDKLIKEEDKNIPTIFEKNMKKLKDLIAPEHIDFSISPKYATLGDKYYIKTLYVGTLPNSVSFATFLHTLFNLGNIDTSIFIKPVDNQVAISQLTKLRTNLEMEYLETNSPNRQDDMSSKIFEAKRLREEIRDGLNKIYEVCIIATIYEDSLRNLNNTTDKLKEQMGQQEIGIKSATYIQEEGYMSNKPLLTNLVNEWHTFDKRSLACVFPFTTNNINHPNGILFAFNQENGLPIFFDTFDSSLNNYNMVIFAKSGAGKSTTVKSLSARSATLDNIQTIALDIEPEYIDISNILGGVNIKIAPNSDTIINPFDIIPDIVKNKITGKKEEKILLNNRINDATNILITMAKGNIGNNQYYNDITRAIIKEIVELEYRRVGITENIDSLYEYEEERIIGDKIVGGRRKKELPTLSSWYQQLEIQAKENTNETYRPYYDYLLKVMANYCKYKNGSFTCFDGQTNVDLSYDIPFINFDLSELNEVNELPLAQHIVCDYIWEKLVKRNNEGHKIRVIIDEAWRMVKFSEAVNFLVTMFRRARKKNTSTVVISQQFDEFYKEETKPIIKNADTKLFLMPDKSSVAEIKEVFKLTEGEAHFLRNCQKGEGLFIVNNVSAKIDIFIPDFEFAFVETNQNKKKSKKEGA